MSELITRHKTTTATPPAKIRTYPRTCTSRHSASGVPDISWTYRKNGRLAKTMNTVPAYSPAPAYLLNDPSDGENPPVLMVAMACTTASIVVIPMAV